MSSRPARRAMIEQLVADGFTHMFGNPGTVEQSFLDVLEDFPQLQYVLCLQESIAVLAADGYARATRRPALVQLHSTPGLGNGIGALYQAWRGQSPLIVINGEAGLRYRNLDAQMAGDLLAMAAPVTKWATVVVHPASLLRVLRRAVRVAMAPPCGPVYICLPEDVLDADIDEPVAPTVLPSLAAIADDETLKAAAKLLAAAATPMVFIGDGIARSAAQAELTAVAERIGAEVWECDAGEVNIAHDHPQYRGMTGHMFGAASKPVFGKGDVNLICGTYVAPEVYPEIGPIFADGARVIHVDADAGAIGKNHPVDLAAVCDPKRSLARLAQILDATMTAAEKAAAARRRDALAAAAAAGRQRALAAEAAVRDQVPMRFSRFMAAFTPRLPADAIVFDEALTNSPSLTLHRPPTVPGSYFLTRGGSLGVSLPGVIGIKCAHPDQAVVAVSGDGGAMYTIQALWTAARHRLGVIFVICNNRSYRLLQLNLAQYRTERNLPARSFPLCFDLSQPPLHFDRMAEAFGVAAERIELPDEIGPAIERALAHGGPYLLDVVLEGEVHPDLIGVRCGQ